MPGLEPGASCSQSRRASQTALHPDEGFYRIDDNGFSKQTRQPNCVAPLRQVVREKTLSSVAEGWSLLADVWLAIRSASLTEEVL